MNFGNRQPTTGGSSGPQDFPAWSLPPYPAWLLGETMGPAVMQHHRNSGVLLEIIGPGALGAMAIACQDLFDVQRPNCSPSPTSLYVMFVAETGKGKDFGTAPFFAPILNYQAEADRTHRAEAENFRQENRIWKLREARVVKSLAKLSLESDDSVLRSELREIDENRPVMPKCPKVITSDTTTGAITESLCIRWRATSSYNMEGGNFLNGLQGRNLGFWNDAWGGQRISRERVGEEPIFVDKPRVSFVMSIQYAPLSRFFKRVGSEGHQSGFTQRILLSCVEPYSPSVEITGEQKDTSLIDACTARCKELLIEAEGAGYKDDERTVVQFSAGASGMFLDILNGYRRDSNPGQRYQSMAGYAMKAPENIARIAAILHVVDKLPGAISENTLHRAHMIGHWHVEQFFAMYSDPASENKAMYDSVRLSEVLRYAQRSGHAMVAKSDLNFWCPPDLQGKKLKAALHGLIVHGQADLRKSKYGTFVCLTQPKQLGYFPQ